jgi:PAS domain S-box-containing protein
MIAEVEDYAIILLNEKGEIQNWNAGAEKIKGYTSQEIVGKNFRIFYTGKDQEENLPEMLLNHSIAHGKAVHEGWRVRKDGTHFWGSIVLTALHNSEGAIIGFSKVTRDLSERKRAEDKMHDYMNELEKQNKALEQFAYVASHDLQEPLRKIQTYAEIIEHNIGNDSVLQKYIVKINASGKRMSDLIRSVLNYSRLSDNTRELVDVDLYTLVTSVITDYELKIEETNATISCEALPSIKGIPLQLNQLFANLIGNALKFTDKKPAIKIYSYMRAGDEITDIPFGHHASNYVEVVVTDNGIGFDQQYEKLIFTMFQRLHGRHEYSGTGIGLALCKRIMENHNGFIKATGELSKGASFSLYFPIDHL